MTIKTFIPGLLTAASLTGAAPADFESASVEDVSASLGTPAGLTTWRVYVNFDDPFDWLLGIAGYSDSSPLIFETDAPDGLVNAGGVLAGLKDEDFAGYWLSERWDSWITIDHDEYLGNDTDYSPGFLDNDGIHAVVLGSAWSDVDDGWYDSNLGTPALAGSDLRVLIAQFTIAEGHGFLLSGMADYQPGSGGGIRSDPFSVEIINDPITVTNVIRSTCSPTDVNGSGATDFADLLAMLDAWGPCTYDFELTAQERSFSSSGRSCNDECEQCQSYWTTIAALGFGRFRLGVTIDSALRDDAIALTGVCSGYCGCAGSTYRSERADIRLEFDVHAPLSFAFVADVAALYADGSIHLTGPAGFDLSDPVDTTGILSPGHYVLTAEAEADGECGGDDGDVWFAYVLDLDGTRFAADVDRNGTVDFDDLLRVLANWGNCTESGACCLPDGTCTGDLTYEDCLAAGGDHAGWGTWCDTVDCPE